MSEPKPKLVVFCGAGLSVGAGLPTMLTFSHAVRKCPLIPDDDKLAFDRIQIACSSLTAMTGASSRNLEDITSLLAVLDLSRPNVKLGTDDRALTPLAALKLVERCVRTVFSPRSHDCFSNAGALLAQVLRNAEVTIVTTNYDMNIEIGAARLGAPIETSQCVRQALVSPGAGLPSTACSIYSSVFGAEENRSSLKFRLYKLHGSVNWCIADGVFRVEDRWYGVDFGQRGPTRFELGHTERPLDLEESRMVLPAVIKAHGLNELAEEWQGAAEAMSTADAVWFVGYSFPSTDAFMRYFLAGALRENTRIRQIALIDPNAIDILDRTADLFASAEFEDIVVPVPLRWEDFTQNMNPLLTRTWRPSSREPWYSARREQLEAEALMRGYLPSLEREQDRGTAGMSRIMRRRRGMR